MEFNIREAPRHIANRRQYVDERHERGEYTWGYPELSLQYMLNEGRFIDWYFLSEKAAHNLFLALGKHFAGKAHRAE